MIGSIRQLMQKEEEIFKHYLEILSCHFISQSTKILSVHYMYTCSSRIKCSYIWLKTFLCIPIELLKEWCLICRSKNCRSPAADARNGISQWGRMATEPVGAEGGKYQPGVGRHPDQSQDHPWWRLHGLNPWERWKYIELETDWTLSWLLIFGGCCNFL